MLKLKSIVAERRIPTASTKDTPPDTDYTYISGEEELDFFEKENSWLAPIIVVDAPVEWFQLSHLMAPSAKFQRISD